MTVDKKYEYGSCASSCSGTDVFIDNKDRNKVCLTSCSDNNASSLKVEGFGYYNDNVKN